MILIFSYLLIIKIAYDNLVYRKLFSRKTCRGNFQSLNKQKLTVAELRVIAMVIDGLPSENSLPNPNGLLTPVLPMAQGTICTLYKHSRAALPADVECLADIGYQGLKSLHKNSRTPFKKPKGGELTDQQKQFNFENL